MRNRRPKLLLLAVSLWLATLPGPGNAWAAQAGEDLGLRVDQGLAALAEGRFDEARDSFSAGLDAARQTGDAAWTGRFHFYLGLSDQLAAEEAGASPDAPLLESAAERYRQALQAIPRDGDSLNNLAQVRWRQRRTADAAAAFEQALAAASGERLAFYARNYGRLLGELGSWKRSAAVYWQGLAAAPDDPALIQDLQELLARHDPAGLPRLPAWLIEHSQVAQAERCAAWALAQRAGSPAVQVDLLALLAAALARQADPPAEFLKESTARVLEEATALPAIGPGAREILLLQGGDRVEPADYSWWPRQDEPLDRERPPVESFRELVRSLADRHAAAQEDLKAEAYYRLAEDLVPGKTDVQAALGRAELYAAAGRDTDLEFLLADLAVMAPETAEAVEVHTAVGVLYDLLGKRTGRPVLRALAAEQLGQAYRLAKSGGSRMDPGFLRRVAEVQQAAGRPGFALEVRLELAELYVREDLEAAAREEIRRLRSDPRWSLVRDPSAEDRLSRLETQLGVTRSPRLRNGIGDDPIEEEESQQSEERAELLRAPQAGRGKLSGTVVSDDGSPLPGVVVTLAEDGAALTQTSDARGEFRFFGLPPGVYDVTAELEGFSPVMMTVQVGLGGTVGLQLPMIYSTIVTEEIVVTEALPPFEGRPLSTQVADSSSPLHVPQTLAELPLASLENAVSGAASGAPLQASIDGVVLSDPASLLRGLSLGGLDGVLIQSGGPDATAESAGLTIHAITRSALSLRGSGWASVSEPDWQPTTTEASRLEEAEERGIELGGSVLRHLELWGQLSRREETLVALGGGRQSDRSDTLAFRPAVSLGEADSLNGLFYAVEGRTGGRGAAPDRSPETTLDEERKTTLAKLEENHQFGSRFYLTTLAAWDEARTERVPRGGATEGAVWHRNLVWRRSSLFSASDRTGIQGRVDGLGFFGERGQHELKAGVSYRTIEEEARSLWPGVGAVVSYSAFSTAEAHAPSATRVRTDLWGAYVQDTMAFENLTVNLGVRYDLQTGRNLASAVAANPLFPVWLPQAEFGGDNPDLRWEALSPRLSLKYQAGESRQTELDAWYARYSDRLDAATVLLGNPLAHRSVYFRWIDFDGEGVFDPFETVTDPVFRGVDPERPGATVLGGFAPGFGPGITDEVAFGIRRSFAGGWAAGAQLTWRNRHDIPELERLVYDSPRGPESGIGRPHRRGDYELFGAVTGTLPDGQPYSVPVYRLRPGVTWLGGFLATNGEREQDFTGVTLELEKDSGPWQLQARFEWRDHTWSVPEEEREDPTNLLGSGDDDGAAVLIEVAGLGAQPPDYLGGRWSFDLTSRFQIAPRRPWGFDTLVRLAGREGEPIPYFRRVGPEETGDGVVRFVQVTPRPDSYRSEDLFLLDAVLRKTFERDDWTFRLDLTAANLLDSRTVLRREPMLGFSRSDHVEEVARARSLSLGLTINFR